MCTYIYNIVEIKTNQMKNDDDSYIFKITYLFI